MRITSVETTPNPNSMKLNLDEELGAAKTYTAAELELSAGCPGFVSELLAIAEIQSVFVCHDFITLNKDPRAGWPEILSRATSILNGEESPVSIVQQRQSAEKEGQVQVLVQTFKGVPIQVKVVDQQGESRISLGAQFNETAMLIQEKSGADFLKERYWADHGVRYGERDEVAAQVADEIRGKFDDKVFERVIAEALGNFEGSSNRRRIAKELLAEWLRHEDWHKRLAAVEELSHYDDPIEQLVIALRDSNPHVRRLAAAALGATGNSACVMPLCEALLNDESIAVRRTAGDALSDIGDVSAQPSIIKALKDPNKLVRWRAARFLSDIGTDEALPSLELASDDKAFEVRLEVKAAIDRITGGGKGAGPAWRRIAEQQNN